MGTKALIALQGQNLFIASICYHDGHPEGVGKTLVKNWATIQDVNKLIDKGIILRLGTNMNNTEFYKNFNGVIFFETFEELYKASEDYADFLYVFDNNNKWQCFNLYTKQKENLY